MGLFGTTFSFLAAVLFLKVEVSTGRRLMQDGPSGYNKPYLDGPFLINATESGKCLTVDGSKIKAVKCKPSDRNQKWHWMISEPLALRSKGNGLCLTKKGSKVTLKKCKKAKTQLWGCKQRKAPLMIKVEEGDQCLRVRKDSNLDLIKCEKFEDGQKFHLYGTRDSSICVKQTKSGKRTTDPNYYLLKNDLWRLNWPQKYAKIFLVYNKDMYDRFLRHYKKASIARQKIKDHAIEALSILDKAYKQIKVRMLLAGIEIWHKKDKISKTIVFKTLRREFRSYVFNTLRKEHKFDSAVYVYGGKWDGNFGGIGINDMCDIDSNNIKDEVFAMVNAFSVKAKSLANILTHEIGHQFNTGHRGEPSNPCPTFRLYGTYCTMSGNNFPKGFSSKMLANIRKHKYDCLNNKPPQKNIFACGNGKLDVGEECDCGKSKKCQTSHPCCDGRLCKLKKDAQCSSGKCCTNCKFDEKKRGCSGNTITISKTKGRIHAPSDYFYTRTNWKIVAPRGKRIVLEILRMDMEYKDECPYDYLEIRDGGNRKSKLIGKYCRKPVHSIIKSKSNQLYLSYRSDGSLKSFFTLSHRTIGGRG